MMKCVASIIYLSRRTNQDAPKQSTQKHHKHSIKVHIPATETTNYNANSSKKCRNTKKESIHKRKTKKKKMKMQLLHEGFMQYRILLISPVNRDGLERHTAISMHGASAL